MARKIRGARVLQKRREGNQDGVGKVVMMLLHSVTNVHVLHLQSRSFSEHMALGAYYTAVDKQVDALVEAYQGMHDLIMNYPLQNDFQTGMTALEYMRYLRRGVVDGRKSFPGSELQNILDTIIELIDSTIYKLRFLH